MDFNTNQLSVNSRLIGALIFPTKNVPFHTLSLIFVICFLIVPLDCDFRFRFSFEKNLLSISC